MISNPHSRRFGPRWLSDPLNTDGAKLMEPSEADLDSAATESAKDRDLRDFDLALEQIVFEDCRECPRCGASVDRDGTVHQSAAHDSFSGRLRGGRNMGEPRQDWYNRPVWEGPAPLPTGARTSHSVASLNHPDIVQIHDVGQAGGLPYLSLEFIDGGSLSQQLDGRPQDITQVVCLIHTLARAIHVGSKSLSAFGSGGLHPRHNRWENNAAIIGRKPPIGGKPDGTQHDRGLWSLGSGPGWRRPGAALIPKSARSCCGARPLAHPRSAAAS